MFGKDRERDAHHQAKRQRPLAAGLLSPALLVLVTYTMYVVGRPALIYTVPLCWFGLFRYIFRIKSGKSGDPVKSLLRDVPLFFVSLLWALMVGWALYGR